MKRLILTLILPGSVMYAMDKKKLLTTEELLKMSLDQIAKISDTLTYPQISAYLFGSPHVSERKKKRIIRGIGKIISKSHKNYKNQRIYSCDNA